MQVVDVPTCKAPATDASEKEAIGVLAGMTAALGFHPLVEVPLVVN
jgi:hypothetical protein